MFNPKFTITNRLLSNIKQINSVVLELNSRRFPKIILFELEKAAREISVHASTSIEGNPLPLTDVKRILKSMPQNIQKSEQEVINYDLILSIHKKITDRTVPASQSGKLRKEPVFVNNPKTGQTVYLPPDAPDVPQLMKDLIKFTKISKDAIDPLISAGIFHKQFVIIHPFMDGNGRTARLATKVLLTKMGLDTFNLFSFENYYNRNVTGYFGNVGVSGNYYDIFSLVDFTGWLIYFTDGLLDELQRVKKLLLEFPKTPETELLSFHKNILAFIEKNGYITDQTDLTPEFLSISDRCVDQGRHLPTAA